VTNARGEKIGSRIAALKPGRERLRKVETGHTKGRIRCKGRVREGKGRSRERKEKPCHEAAGVEKEEREKDLQLLQMSAL